MNLYLGIDFGTSGARAVVIDETGIICAESSYIWRVNESEDWAKHWQIALFSLISQIPVKLRRQIRAIAIDGTSSTVMLCDRAGVPIAAPILYNDARGVAMMEKLRAIAPPHHPVISATSSLAKLLWLQANFVGATNVGATNVGATNVGATNVGAGLANNPGILPTIGQQNPPFNPGILPTIGQQNPPLSSDSSINHFYFLHQADWIAFLLHGQLGVSDYHNALKLGYDPEKLCYPDWIYKINNLPILPDIVQPGKPVGEITKEIADRFELPTDCAVCAGTTDSIAAFLASGAKSPGEAVTSLGSTLVLKLLSRDRVDDSRYGIYSHRLGDLWLTGGASNTGGAVLRQFFTDAELQSLSDRISPERESPLDYYPLIKAGDRFPINDPHLLPRLDPRPGDRVEFLHGLLESIARIEARGYHLLQELGANELTRVYTAGGGAKNPVWNAIRQRHLKVPVVKSMHAEAAYGTALLAMRGIEN